MTVRLLNLNTHVGQSLHRHPTKGLRHLKKKFDPDIVIVQEVNRPLSRARLRRLFPWATWISVGMLPLSVGPSSNGAIVLAKRNMFKKVGKTNTPLTEQRFDNGKRDKWHPSRRIITMVLQFKNQRGKKFAVSSDHAWTKAGHSEGVIVNTHNHQIRRFAVDSDGYLKKGIPSIRGGDYNEHIAPGGGEAYVEEQFPRVGLRAARPLHYQKPRLDEIWVSKQIRVTSWEYISEEEGNTDHEGIVIDFNVV